MPNLEYRFDEAQLAKFRERVERLQGRPLQDRMAKGALEAARMMTRPIKAAAPRKSGRLRGSVKARAERGSYGLLRGAVVGPTAPHRHLVIRGTKAHSLETKRPGKSLYALPYYRDVGRGGRGLEKVKVIPTRYLHHPGSRPNPFVDNAVQRHEADIYRIVADTIWKG